MPLVLVSASMAGHWLGDGFSEWGLLILLLLPVAGWCGWRLGVESRNWRWRFYGMVVLGLGGVAFGEVMEGAEGALWGGLIGVVVGFLCGWYSPWVARTVPERWSLGFAWSVFAFALFSVPLALGLRLFFGRLDDDDSTWFLMAGFAAILFANGKDGWKRDSLGPRHLVGRFAVWLLFWCNPRVLPFVVSFLVAGLWAGPFGTVQEVVSGEGFSVRVLGISYVWPVSMCLACLVAWLWSRRRMELVDVLYRPLIALVFVVFGATIFSQLRFRCEVDAGGLEVRMGLWKSISLTRSEVDHVETDVARGRSYVLPHPVIVTAAGERFPLLDLGARDELTEWLVGNWGLNQR